MRVTGDMIIGSRAVRGTAGEVYAYDPGRGVNLAPSFGTAGVDLVNLSCNLADAAFDAYRNTALEARATFLERIAENILALGDALIARAQAESALSVQRLEGERTRTVGQLRFFASLVRAGRWLDVTLDSAMPDRKPLPRSDLRLQKIPLGPVAVFGASNFPLAFSVAGGDTASALAAGCPVIVKAHPAHLGTSELVARAIQRAVQECQLPEGVFSLLIGTGNETGEALVSHPAIKAVGFTGSRTGGLALVNIASRREEPIPVYAEMSSINPFFVLPAALAKRTADIASGLADSVTLGVGQFCTNPGLVLLIDSLNAQQFVGQLAESLAKKEAQSMLTAGIFSAYENALVQRAGTAGIHQVTEGMVSHAPHAVHPSLFTTTAANFIKNSTLREEIFGPASLVVFCSDAEELLRVAQSLEGQLTCTLQIEPEDYALAVKLLPILERKAGRILSNGFPTGVEVSYAMVHGGPFPATSDGRTTSVGAHAIERFLRPVCYQDMPADLLPNALRDENPLRLPRLKDGQGEYP